MQYKTCSGPDEVVLHELTVTIPGSLSSSFPPSPPVQMSATIAGFDLLATPPSEKIMSIQMVCCCSLSVSKTWVELNELKGGSLVSSSVYLNTTRIHFPGCHWHVIMNESSAGTISSHTHTNTCTNTHTYERTHCECVCHLDTLPPCDSQLDNHGMWQYVANSHALSLQWWLQHHSLTHCHTYP